MAGALAIWLVGLLVVDAIYGERYGERIADRVAASVQGHGSYGASDLALIRGKLAIDDLRVDRDDKVGRLALTVGTIRCDLPPLGIGLFDRTCRELDIGDVDLQLSTFALFQLRKPKRPPIHADRVVIDHATMTFSPSAVVPSLGKVRLVIDHAEAGPTVFKTPLSWLFQLRVLHATIELPIGNIGLTYGDGRFGAVGSVFGSHPVEIPFRIPLADPVEDARAEVRRLVAVGRGLAEKLLAQKTRDWLRDKVP